MRVADTAKQLLGLWVAAALPLALWAMLVLGLQAGEIHKVWNPASPISLIDGLRAILPFTAAFLAAFIVFNKITRRQPRDFAFLGPLGFATGYGLVGLVSALISPSSWVALFWTILYLSVPLVLVAIVWHGDSLEQISRIIKFNWTIVFLLTVALVAVALIRLDLANLIANPVALPSALLD